MKRLAIFSLVLFATACSTVAPPAASPATPSPSASPPALATVSPDPTDPPAPPTPMGTIIPLASAILDPILADAAERAGVGIEQVAVLLAKAVVWPDGSLGCPQPGIEYPQVQVEGYRLIVWTPAATFDYRGAGAGAFRHCPFAGDRGSASPGP